MFDVCIHTHTHTHAYMHSPLAGERLGLWSKGSLSLSGEQLETLSPKELADTIMQVRLTSGGGSDLTGVKMASYLLQTAVFYRVTPKHKVVIVKVKTSLASCGVL